MISMSILTTSLFAAAVPMKVGVGFHNIGSGVLRASNKEVVQKIEAHYGARCGHLPLEAEQVRVFVTERTPAIELHMAYLSHLFGKELRAVTAAEFLRETPEETREHTVVVPYVNVPEAETWIEGELGASSWGLPAQMVHVLKNKASFYQLVDMLDLADFQTPDYRIARVEELPQVALAFLAGIEEMLKEAGLTQYPLGVMMRAAESDGNYGCSLVYEQGKRVWVVQDGDAVHAVSYASWEEALQAAQRSLAATMNQQKEARVVISRFLDLADSPGMSVVIMDDQVETLGWNGQLQKEGSKACVGTSTYMPRNAEVARLQEAYEGQTVAAFEELLRKTARHCGVDFASIRGVANIDMILPGPLELALRKHRGQKEAHYLAECNPRWTNYTDAIMTVLGASQRVPTIQNMRAVIQEGILAVDKYVLPAQLDPREVRDAMLQRDAVLKGDGVRIICRMANHPMGVIFAGDLERAQAEFAQLLQGLVAEK